MNKTKIISALVLGAAVTAGISLLLNSEKGSSMVKKISEKKEGVKNSTIESVVNFLFTIIDKLTSDKVNASTATKAAKNTEEVAEEVS